MKKDYLQQTMNHIGDDYIEEAAQGNRKVRKHPRHSWVTAVAAVLALAVLTGVALRPGESPLSVEAYAVSEAKYPETSAYPNEEEFYDAETAQYDEEAYEAASQDWWLEYEQRIRQMDVYAGALDSYCTASIRQFLQGADTENRVFSPLNLYMALAVLAEITDGESRQQILNLLNAADMETLRTQAQAVWNANYCADDMSTSVLANSLWLDESLDFNRDTIDYLAEAYYASTYQGTMGADDLNGLLQEWLNDQTGGLLKDQAGNAELDPDAVLALASTVYFQARWTEEFEKEDTEQGIFHTPSGDVDCEFMHQTRDQAYYCSGEFSAVAQDFTSGGTMWFILPDDGVSIDDLLADPEVMEFIMEGYAFENHEFVTVNMSVPKFDVSSSLDLTEGLKALGITDIFDSEAADFSPITSIRDAAVTQAQHAARVTIDEEGCTAAAYVQLGMGGGGMPDREVDFVLDRPFLFVIAGMDGQPLFAGVVNQPNG